MQDLTQEDPPVQAYRRTSWDGQGEFRYYREYAARLTDFILSGLIWGAHGHGGSLGVRAEKTPEFMSQLQAVFPVHSTVAGLSFYEGTNRLARTLKDSRDRYTLEVELRNPTPREQVPEFLWQYTGNGGHFGGVFMSGALDQSTQSRQAPSPTQTDSDDPIPF